MGVRRIFARISPNLPEKVLDRFCANIFSSRPSFGITSKKRISCDSADVNRCFVSNQTRLGAIFAQIIRVFAKVLTDLTQNFA